MKHNLCFSAETRANIASAICANISLSKKENKYKITLVGKNNKECLIKTNTNELYLFEYVKISSVKRSLKNINSKIIIKLMPQI